MPTARWHEFHPSPRRTTFIHYVSISGVGKVSLNSVEMNEDQLLATLVEFRKADPDLNVVLRADSAIDYQRVVNVLDVLIAANVSKVGLATESSKPASPN